MCIKKLQDFVKTFQDVSLHLLTIHVIQCYNGLIHIIVQNKAKVTEETIDAFMDSTRKIDPTIGRPAQPQPKSADAAPATGPALTPSEPGGAS